MSWINEDEIEADIALNGTAEAPKCQTCCRFMTRQERRNNPNNWRWICRPCYNVRGRASGPIRAMDERYTLDHDEPHIIKRHIDVGNCRADPDTPEKLLYFAIIEDAYLTATGQKGDWKQPCREAGCGGKHTNKACALAWFASEDFVEICDLLGIHPGYYNRLMRKEINKPKRAYNRKPRNVEVVLETTEAVKGRGDSRCTSEAGCPPGTPDLGGPLLCGEAPGCDSVPGGFCGYAEPERVGQGEAAI